MHDGENGHDIVNDLIDQEIVPVRDQFACPWDSPGPPHFGMGAQAVDNQRELFIQIGSGPWVLRIDMVVDGSAIEYRRIGPDNLHEPDASALRRESARR